MSTAWGSTLPSSLLVPPPYFCPVACSVGLRVVGVGGRITSSREKLEGILDMGLGGERSGEGGWQALGG